MRADLSAVFERQGGVATTAQILSVVSRRHLEMLLATTAAWTAIEVARILKRPRALATLDAALRSGHCDPTNLEQALRAQSGRRGIDTHARGSGEQHLLESQCGEVGPRLPRQR